MYQNKIDIILFQYMYSSAFIEKDKIKCLSQYIFQADISYWALKEKPLWKQCKNRPCYASQLHRKFLLWEVQQIDKIYDTVKIIFHTLPSQEVYW